MHCKNKWGEFAFYKQKELSKKCELKIRYFFAEDGSGISIVWFNRHFRWLSPAQLKKPFDMNVGVIKSGWPFSYRRQKVTFRYNAIQTALTWVNKNGKEFTIECIGDERAGDKKIIFFGKK